MSFQSFIFLSLAWVSLACEQNQNANLQTVVRSDNEQGNYSSQKTIQSEKEYEYSDSESNALNLKNSNSKSEIVQMTSTEKQNFDLEQPTKPKDDVQLKERNKLLSKNIQLKKKSTQENGEFSVDAMPEESLSNKSIPTKEIIPYEPQLEVVDFNFDHGSFDRLLKENVTAAGRVDYRNLAFQKDELKKYVESLAMLSLEGASRKDLLAFYINAYNANTLMLIIENLPLQSIMDIDNGKPWDREWIFLQGKKMSLNHLEHKIIRKYNEPRIHFAVNCAAISCPKLWNRAFTPQNLESALQKLTKEFVNSSENKISNNELLLSSIFDWYKEDFGDLKSFLSKYSETPFSNDAVINYGKYNWALNKQ